MRKWMKHPERIAMSNNLRNGTGMNNQTYNKDMEDESYR
jgi:hypothetical protein